ncbi:MAG TPA: hypothetical protein VL096_13440, partial [Pirellulaceae bacterium]|nr:hypothetical protein [Pirellulaceae bacterium]
MRLIPCFLLGWLLLGSVAPLAAAELLTFRGSFAPVKVEPGEDLTKTFELQVVDAPADDLQQAGWVLKESGRGAWPWTNRFGMLDLVPRMADRIQNAPCLLYQRPDGYSVVPLPEFRSHDTTELKKDASWKVGPLTYRVLDQERRGEVDAWRVVGNNDYGPQRTLWIEPTTRLVVAGEERVFVGQGTECRLNWELAAREAIDAKQAAEWLAGFEKLSALRAALAWQNQTRELKWTDEQLQTLAKELPALTEAIPTGPLALVVQVAKQDAKTQSSRGDALTALKSQAIGKSPTKFALEGLAGETFTPEKLTDKVTVLHFWDYKDSPLEEPYGQVGYLDFLARQRSKSGVQVYGVVVD